MERFRLRQIVTDLHEAPGLLPIEPIATAALRVGLETATQYDRRVSQTFWQSGDARCRAAARRLMTANRQHIGGVGQGKIEHPLSAPVMERARAHPDRNAHMPTSTSDRAVLTTAVTEAS
jgi:hypothetical protein